MRLVAAVALLATLMLLKGDNLFSQDQKDPPKVKPILPADLAKLELGAEQKAAIKKLQALFEAKRKQLQSEEREEIMKLLTPVQKKKLLESAAEDAKKDKK